MPSHKVFIAHSWASKIKISFCLLQSGTRLENVGMTKIFFGCLLTFLIASMRNIDETLACVCGGGVGVGVGVYTGVCAWLCVC